MKEPDSTGRPRWAAITGASSGIGAEFARQLQAQGFRLFLIARREEKLRELAVQWPGAEYLAADLASDAGVEAAAGAMARIEPALLVNNAGFGTKGRFHQAGLDRQLEMHRLHVMATVRLSHAALQPMVVRNAGAIINVSSVAAFARSPGNTSYCATKAWMNAFTEGLYLDLRHSAPGVTVQALCPGFTYSEFHEAMGVSRDSVAKRLWLPAEFVVRESLRALATRKLFVIPGWRYRAFAAVFSKVPVALRLLMEGRHRRSHERV